jgi:RimJ/RimL family protein N-acetyltransferase
MVEEKIEGMIEDKVGDRHSLRVIGSSRYYEWNARLQEVAVGYTFLARSHWGGEYNRELKALMLAHAFRFANRVWFHIGVDNIRSRKAMEKIGGRLSHMAFRDQNGRRVENCYYYIDRDGDAGILKDLPR